MVVSLVRDLKDCGFVGDEESLPDLQFVKLEVPMTHYYCHGAWTPLLFDVSVVADDFGSARVSAAARKLSS